MPAPPYVARSSSGSSSPIRTSSVPATLGTFSVMAIAATVAIGLAACNLPGSEAGRFDGIIVDNRTGMDLRFEVVIDGRLVRPAKRALRHSTALVIAAGDIRSGRCTTSPLVALTEEGQEIARHDAPLCVGDTWVINDPGVSPTSS